MSAVSDQKRIGHPHQQGGLVEVYALDTDSPVPRGLTDDLSDDLSPSGSRHGN